MFTLAEQPAEPYWIDLPWGVRVQVRPLNQVISTAAGAHASRRLAELVAGQAELLALGVAGNDGPDLTDPDIRDGVMRELFTIGLARHGIIAWEGVGNADGTAPLDCTPETREAFARSALAGAFLDRYDAPLRQVRAEGNASAPGPNGNSDPGADTAASAPPSAPSAQVH